MLNYFTRGNTAFISSYQLYIALGRPVVKYSWWTHKMILSNENIFLGEDFISNTWYQDHLPNNNQQGRPVKDYLIRPHLAITLCILSKSSNSRTLKKFLLQGFKHTIPSA